MSIVIENPSEIWGPKKVKDEGHCVGSTLINFEVLDEEGKAYSTDEEILLEFSNGKEMRIYIHENGNLHVYTD